VDTAEAGPELVIHEVAGGYVVPAIAAVDGSAVVPEDAVGAGPAQVKGGDNGDSGQGWLSANREIDRLLLTACFTKPSGLGWESMTMAATWSSRWRRWPSPEACSGPSWSESGGHGSLKRCRDDAGRSRNRSRFTGVPEGVCFHPGRKPDWMSRIAQLLPDRGPDGCFRLGEGLVEAPGAGTIMVKRPRWSRARGRPGNPDRTDVLCSGVAGRGMPCG
jgi:hypothetical protein